MIHVLSHFFFLRGQTSIIKNIQVPNRAKNKESFLQNWKNLYLIYIRTLSFFFILVKYTSFKKRSPWHRFCHYKRKVEGLKVLCWVFIVIIINNNNNNYMKVWFLGNKTIIKALFQRPWFWGVSKEDCWTSCLSIFHIDCSIVY